jgi:beta-glucanase (GH16 family)
MKQIMNLLAILWSLFAITACGGSDDGGSGSSTPSTITITVSPESISSPATGGSYTVNVNTTGVEWGAYPDSEWIKTTVTGSNTSKGSVSVTISANTSTTQRTGTIMIQSGTGRKTINITQDAPLQVSEEKVYTSSKGETIDVEVTSSSEWTATASDSWITTKKNGSTLSITTSANDAQKERTGKVTVQTAVESKEISVVQASAEDREIVAPDGYRLVWHDEFSEGTTLNSDWTHEVQNSGWVNHELQNYRNGTADGKRVTELVDGRLHINCFKGSDGKIYSGRVYAKVKQGWTYGYIEASIKLPKGKGTWPAFWMMPVNFRSWPADGEIDIMEEVGYHPDYVSSSLHANAHVHSNGTQVTHEMYCKGAEGEFHKYAIEWTHEKITTFVDGKVQLTYANRNLGRDDWPYDDPFYVILNLAWGGDWGGAQGVDESKLPVTMEVDYVRVFQKK